MQNPYMKLALEEAKKAYNMGEVPVGAVIEKGGEVISKAYNLTRSLKDVTAHAEILAIRKASDFLGEERLNGCNIYITLEPCAMCATAISYARLDALYYALDDEKFGAVRNGVRFFSSSNCFHQPEIYEGIMEEEAKALMQSFFQNLRK